MPREAETTSDGSFSLPLPLLLPPSWLVLSLSAARSVLSSFALQSFETTNTYEPQHHLPMLQFEAYLCYSIMLTGFVYPVVVYSIWSSSGFITAFNDNPAFGCGMHDFAGSGVVHMTGGMTALVAAKVLGPRIGKLEVSR